MGRREAEPHQGYSDLGSLGPHRLKERAVLLAQLLKFPRLPRQLDVDVPILFSTRIMNLRSPEESVSSMSVSPLDVVAEWATDASSQSGGRPHFARNQARKPSGAARSSTKTKSMSRSRTPDTAMCGTDGNPEPPNDGRHPATAK